MYDIIVANNGVSLKGYQMIDLSQYTIVNGVAYPKGKKEIKPKKKVISTKDLKGEENVKED